MRELTTDNSMQRRNGLSPRTIWLILISVSTLILVSVMTYFIWVLAA